MNYARACDPSLLLLFSRFHPRDAAGTRSSREKRERRRVTLMREPREIEERREDISACSCFVRRPGAVLDVRHDFALSPPSARLSHARASTRSSRQRERERERFLSRREDEIARGTRCRSPMIPAHPRALEIILISGLPLAPPSDSSRVLPAPRPPSRQRHGCRDSLPSAAGNGAGFWGRGVACTRHEASRGSVGSRERSACRARTAFFTPVD